MRHENLHLKYDYKFSNAYDKIRPLPESMEVQPKQLPRQEQQIHEMTHLREREMTAELKGEYKLSVYVLDKLYGVKTLTPIEAVHLRKIIKECITSNPENSNASSIFIPWREAIDRWLFQLYSINANDVPLCKEIYDQKGNRFVYQRWEKDKAHQKEVELTISNQYRRAEETVTDDFKKYLQVLRERAHFP